MHHNFPLFVDRQLHSVKHVLVVIKEFGLLALSALQYQEALLLQVDYLDTEYAEDPISRWRCVILLLEPDDLKPHGSCPAHFD